LQAGGVGSGDGSSQGLIAWGDGFDLDQGTAGGGSRWVMSCKQSGVLLCVECGGGVEKGE